MRRRPAGPGTSPGGSPSPSCPGSVGTLPGTSGNPSPLGLVRHSPGTSRAVTSRSSHSPTTRSPLHSISWRPTPLPTTLQPTSPPFRPCDAETRPGGRADAVKEVRGLRGEERLPGGVDRAGAGHDPEAGLGLARYAAQAEV